MLISRFKKVIPIFKHLTKAFLIMTKLTLLSIYIHDYYDILKVGNRKK